MPSLRRRKKKEWTIGIRRPAAFAVQSNVDLYSLGKLGGLMRRTDQFTTHLDISFQFKRLSIILRIPQGQCP